MARLLASFLLSVSILYCEASTSLRPAGRQVSADLKTCSQSALTDADTFLSAASDGGVCLSLYSSANAEADLEDALRGYCASNGNQTCCFETFAASRDGDAEPAYVGVVYNSVSVCINDSRLPIPSKSV